MWINTRIRGSKQWGNELIPCSNNICDILKRFRSFKIPAITLIWPKPSYKHSVTRSYRSGKESGRRSESPLWRHQWRSFCLYISRWWRQTWDTALYFTVVNQSEARISREHGIMLPILGTAVDSCGWIHNFYSNQSSVPVFTCACYFVVLSITVGYPLATCSYVLVCWDYSYHTLFIAVATTSFNVDFVIFLLTCYSFWYNPVHDIDIRILV